MKDGSSVLFPDGIAGSLTKNNTNNLDSVTWIEFSFSNTRREKNAHALVILIYCPGNLLYHFKLALESKSILGSDTLEQYGTGFWVVCQPTLHGMAEKSKKDEYRPFIETFISGMLCPEASISFAVNSDALFWNASRNDFWRLGED